MCRFIMAGLILQTLVFSHTAEISFKFLNADVDTILVTAEAQSPVYWKGGYEAQQYQTKTCAIPTDEQFYPGFDLLDFNTAGDRTLGMSLYEFSFSYGSIVFRWDTRD